MVLWKKRFNRQNSTFTGSGAACWYFWTSQFRKNILNKFLKERFTSTPITVLNCQKITSEAKYFFNEILKELTHELKSMGQKNLPDYSECKDSEDFKNKFLHLYELRYESGYPEPFLIMFDESDYLFPDRKREESFKILKEYIRIFSMLRGMAETRQCFVILDAAG